MRMKNLSQNSLNEFQSTLHFSLYPNPGIDQLGRKMANYQLEGTESIINTSDLPPGMYSFIFTSSNIRESRTWVKAE